MKNLLVELLLCVPLISPALAFAEANDTNQPIQIYADKFEGDEVKQVAVYSGKVAIHQGTLEIHGDKLILSIDPDGYKHGVVTPVKGQLVKFRQRSDSKKPGVEEWMAGQGELLSYNEKTNQLVLSKNAQVSRSENGKKLDESNGAKITYNLTDSTAKIDGDKSLGARGRVSTIIAPRSERKEAEQKTAKPLTLEAERKISK